MLSNKIQEKFFLQSNGIQALNNGQGSTVISERKEIKKKKLKILGKSRLLTLLEWNAWEEELHEERASYISRGIPLSLWLSADLHICEKKFSEPKEITARRNG